MDPPHFLLDALKASITSGTFIDTKFYVFSLQDSSGCVGFPRPLYCNSRVLNTVPYFSTCKFQKPLLCLTPDNMVSVFSNGYSEGEMKNLNEGFPSDTPHFAADYDYLSDSDLEDDETELSIDDRPSDSRFTLTKATAEQPHPSQGTTKVENLHGSALRLLLLLSRTTPQLTCTADQKTIFRGRGRLPSSVTWQR